MYMETKGYVRMVRENFLGKQEVLVCDPDSMSYTEFQSIMEWTGDYTDGLDCCIR